MTYLRSINVINNLSSEILDLLKGKEAVEFYLKIKKTALRTQVKIETVALCELINEIIILKEQVRELKEDTRPYKGF